MKKYYRNDRRLSVKLASLLREIYLEFGLLPRIVAPLIGRYFHYNIIFNDRIFEYRVTFGHLINKLSHHTLVVTAMFRLRTDYVKLLKPHIYSVVLHNLQYPRICQIG